MRTKTQFLAGVYASLILFGTAPAQSVLSYFASTPAVSAPSGSFTNWTKTLQLPKFDASLGTLTEVTLSYVGEALQTARGENLAGGPAPFSYNITTALTLSKTGGPVLFSPASIVLAGSGTNGVFDGAIDFAGPSAFNVTQTVATSGSITSTTMSILADYTGSGLIDFTAAALATSSVSGGGQFVSQTISKASAGLTVQYTFTPIPESSSYAVIFGVVALGLVTFQRRNRFGL